MYPNIRALLVDDEESSCQVLSAMLEKHCPHVEICGQAASVDMAVEQLRMHHPQLVFLDVKMPDKSGFDLLRLASPVDFEVIFISGYDEYAITAFEFSAVDYVLKPIDYTRLMVAVERASARITAHAQPSEFTVHFIQSVDEKTHLLSRLRMHHHNQVHLVDVHDIIYIRAQRDYCMVYTSTPAGMFVNARKLADFELLLSPYRQFLRIHKGMVINTAYIERYSKGAFCYIKLRGVEEELEVSRRKKKEIIERLELL